MPASTLEQDGTVIMSKDIPSGRARVEVSLAKGLTADDSRELVIMLYHTAAMLEQLHPPKQA